MSRKHIHAELEEQGHSLQINLTKVDKHGKFILTSAPEISEKQAAVAPVTITVESENLDPVTAAQVVEEIIQMAKTTLSDEKIVPAVESTALPIAKEAPAAQSLVSPELPKKKGFPPKKKKVE